MIWIEHDMQMVADLADRIHVLDYGRTLAEGRPSEVLSHPDVISAYLGNAKDLSGLSSGPLPSRPR
jgi:branched-chain amino acid transport system ATP-binding protein